MEIYAASTNNSATSTVNFDELNKYVVETCGLQNPETLRGVITMMVDLGTQLLPDSKYLPDAEDLSLTKEQLNTKYADDIASGKITKFDDAYHNESKSFKVHKFVPQKPRQAVVFAVDFPEIMLDKGQFFGETEPNPKPLRLWFGGQYWDKEQEKMVVQNVIPLKVTKDDNIAGGKEWTMGVLSTPYKMALGAKLINPNDAFNPSRVSELLGKTLQFEARVYYNQGKNGKMYYTEKLKYVGALGRGQEPLKVDNTYLIQMNQPNDPQGLKELRKHVINTIENATNFNNSALQKQLAEVRGIGSNSHNNATAEETPVVPKATQNVALVQDDEDDSELPF